MADVPYVCLYLSYLQSLSPFTDEECGRIIRAMLNYAETGEAPQFEGNERFIWPSLQAQIDRDMEAYRAKCSKNRANGSKGGRPPKNPTVIPETERFLEKPKKPKEKEKKKEKEKENEKENESIEADKPPARPRFSPPTVDEVAAYCREQGYTHTDPERFVSYYQANGWRVGKNPMKDWKAALRGWESRERQQGSKGQGYEHGLDRLARMYQEEFGK